MAWTKNRNGYHRPLSLRDRTQHMAAWAREYGLHPMTLKHRLSDGMTLEEALTKPLRPHSRADTPEARREKKARLRKERADKISAQLQNYKATRPCMDCKKIWDPDVMEFDHVRGEKKFSLSDSAGLSLLTIATEIAKCDLVCANCHRIRTKNRRLQT